MPSEWFAASKAADAGVGLRVVLFAGGRGSGALVRQLVADPAVSLTIAINGYDNGASTGAVRRLLGDSLGPSDFRKNASTLAAARRTCEPELVELLDQRLPSSWTEAEALHLLCGGENELKAPPSDPFRARVQRLTFAVAPERRTGMWDRLLRCGTELQRVGHRFDFGDCSLGNLVFVGSYVGKGREFNAAVDDYCALLGIAPGVIENVTDGTNAFLVAVDSDGSLLASEEQIVDTAAPHRIQDIYLVDRELSTDEREAIQGGGDFVGRLLRRAVHPALNPRLAATLAAADLIIYAPGTQHSSLFPSYLTRGLSDVIAGNILARKLLVTNIRSDAEIPDSRATDLIDRALFYLRDKGRADIPAPCLITHYLLNDPPHADAHIPYVPLGPVEFIEDPRMVRIGNYEDGVTGRHDAARVLGPFLTSIVGRRVRPRVAVLLQEGHSLDKVAQTLLEMVRGGAAGAHVELTIFYSGPRALDPGIASRFPFAITFLKDGEPSFAAVARSGSFDYVLLFEASGMYRGEDLIALLTHLAGGRLDAVWGSRRLSVRDIEESYRLRYQHNIWRGTVSYLGSHLLSLTCLLAYGRYVSDTLSGLRAVRADIALDPDMDLSRKDANHRLLSRLLRRKGDLLEVPVGFFPLSPEKVVRTTAVDGLKALATLLFSRVLPAPSGTRGQASNPRALHRVE